jgi:hypothetical protein
VRRDPRQRPLTPTLVEERCGTPMRDATRARRDVLADRCADKRMKELKRPDRREDCAAASRSAVNSANSGSSSASRAASTTSAPAPSTATARASATASAPNRPSRASTEVPTAAGATESNADTLSARALNPPSRDAAISSRTNNGFPPLNSQHPVQNMSSASWSSCARTIAPTPAAVNGPSTIRSTPMSPTSCFSSLRSPPGSPERKPNTNSTARSPARRAR